MFKYYNKQIYLTLGVVLVLFTTVMSLSSQLNKNSSLIKSSRAASTSSPVCVSSFTVYPALTPTPTLTVPTPTPQPCVNQPVDVMLVMDRSSSMNNSEWIDLDGDGIKDPGEEKKKLDWSKDAAKQFVENIALEPASKNGLTRIGVASYGRTLNTDRASKLHLRLTDILASKQDILAAIDSVVYEGSGTCIECGERKATDEFVNSLAPQGVKRVVIETTDGRANRTIASNGSSVGRDPAVDAAINEANYLKTVYNGIAINAEVFAAGYTTTLEADDSDRAYKRALLGIASGTTDSEKDAHCKVAPQNTAAWNEIFESFRKVICPASRVGSSTNQQANLISCSQLPPDSNNK